MDMFRKEGKLLTDKEAAQIHAFKEKAEELAGMMLKQKPNREFSLALTRLEECVMWAVKGMTGEKVEVQN